MGFKQGNMPLLCANCNWIKKCENNENVGYAQGTI